MFKKFVINSFGVKNYKLKYFENKIMHKLLVIVIIIILNFTSVVYADDIDDLEIIDWSDNIVETTNTSEEPKINSRAAVIYDRKSQKVIWGKKENERRPMASTTKIMTAIVVLENANLNDVVTVSKKAGGTGGSRLGLKAGDKITVNNLLYGLLLVSGNDSAVALAEFVGGSVDGFAQMMNKKASELGLENTHFVTPHGLDMQEHYTTAFELAEMADYALNIEKFAQIVNTKNITIDINGRSKNLTNTNELLGNLYGVNGVKTGFTNGANRCLVTSVNRDGMNIITVVLGADTKKDRTNDSVKLVEYAYQNYEIYNTKDIINEKYEEWKNINENRIEVIKGKVSVVNTKLEELDNYYIPIKKVDEGKVNVKIFNIDEVTAPVQKDDYIGKLCVYVDNDKVLELTITVNKGIGKLEFTDYLKSFIVNNFRNMEDAI